MKKIIQLVFVLGCSAGSVLASHNQDSSSLLTDDTSNELDLAALELGALAGDENEAAFSDDEAINVGTDLPSHVSPIPAQPIKRRIVIVDADGTYESAEFEDLTDYYEPRERASFSELSTKDLRVALDQASKNSDDFDSE